jgi:uncharacterized OsmC-like protein
MESQELQAVQAPLKSRYRDEPTSALITLHAEGQLGSEAVSCSVQTGKAIVEAGLHPASGGEGALACSGDMLLQALVACAGVTLLSVATNRNIPIEAGTVRAEGDLDFRGTMAVDRDALVGFSSIRLTFTLQTSASDEDLDALLKATERYCVVYQTLVRSPALSISQARSEPKST